MKILISHVYSNENKGDAALLAVLITELRRMFIDPEITILTMDGVANDEHFEGVPMKNGFMYHAANQYHRRGLKYLYSGLMLITTLSYAAIFRATRKKMPLPRHLKEVAEEYHNTDLIVPVGGGYIRGKSGFVNSLKFLFMVQPLIFGTIIGKPTVNYTQSIGPFGNRLQRIIVTWTLRHLDGIIVRERITQDLLKKLGITKNVILSVDSGFLFTSNVERDLRAELHIPPEQITVGITVRKWLPKKEQSMFESEMATFCDYVIKKYRAAVIFIPQVTSARYHDDDREPSMEIYQQLARQDSAYLILDHLDHHAIKALYGSLDYLVGTRFHSVIFALTSYVPSIAVGYEHKTEGIMRELGLQDWTMPIEEVTAEKLEPLFDLLVAHRDEYRGHLKMILPPYIELAKNTSSFMKNIYENYRTETQKQPAKIIY
jgi:colanic acid/amylovoran biosynthesis protein